MRYMYKSIPHALLSVDAIFCERSSPSAKASIAQAMALRIDLGPARKTVHKIKEIAVPLRSKPDLQHVFLKAITKTTYRQEIVSNQRRTCEDATQETAYSQRCTTKENRQKGGSTGGSMTSPESTHEVDNDNKEGRDGAVDGQV